MISRYYNYFFSFSSNNDLEKHRQIVQFGKNKLSIKRN